MTATPISQADNRTAGILWMLATIFCFITLDAIMKYGLQFASLVEVTWGRFFFATIFAMLLCGRRLPQLAISDAPRVQFFRATLLMVTTGLFNAGVALVPLPTATTIMFLTPVFVTVLSIFLLQEHVGLRRWLSIGLAFIGALIVVAPWQGGLGSMNIGLVYLIAAALTNANYQIVTRKLRNDDPLTSLLYTASLGTIVTTLMLPFYWTSPSPFSWLLLISSGFAGALGHWCLIKSLGAAPASVVAPFSYSSIIWATLFGYLIWQDLPNANTVAGAALIIVSGLYIFYRERALKLSRD